MTTQSAPALLQKTDLEALLTGWPADEMRTMVLFLHTTAHASEKAAGKQQITEFLESHDLEVLNPMDGSPTMVIEATPHLLVRLFETPDVIRHISSILENQLSFVSS